MPTLIHALFIKLFTPFSKISPPGPLTNQPNYLSFSMIPCIFSTWAISVSTQSECLKIAWRLPTGRTSSHQPFRTNPENGYNAANCPFLACTHRLGEPICGLSSSLFHQLEALREVTDKSWGTGAGTTVVDKWEPWPHAQAACVPWTRGSPIQDIRPPLYNELLLGPPNLGRLWVWEYPVRDETSSFWLRGHLISRGQTLHCHQSPAAS